MIDRRSLLLGAALIGPACAAAAPLGQRLETRLFNFRDDVPPDRAAAAIAALRLAAGLPGIGGFMAGRNFIPQPFPTRFEWVYMVQFDPTGGAGSPAQSRFAAAAADVSALCHNQVQCDLAAPMAPRFADAPGVKVRHTVMFDFTPEATAEDQARNVDAIRAMGRLPTVQAYRVERSAVYPSDPTQMQWQVIGDFASVSDYRAYADAPVHLAIRDDFKAHTSRVAFLDLEL